jgi:parallel beta-helix repeat protein
MRFRIAWPSAAFAAGALALFAHASAWADTPGLSPTLSASPPYSCVKNYYVNGATGNDSNPGTAAKPWKTIQNADNGWPNTPVAGECVNVLPGTYPISDTMVFGNGGNANTPKGYVVYRSTVPQGAHIVAQSDFGDLIQLWAPYIVIDGFEIDGNNSVTSGHGVDACADGGGDDLIAHHFTAINNLIHDMGGAGLSTCTAEYITWSHNVIYRTSSTNPYEVSAIDIWQPLALAAGSYKKTTADNTTYHIDITFNITHDNGEGPSIPAPHTDGNGIIIDTTLGSSDCPTCGTPYTGQILVMGNLSYNNGGGGIHVFLSKNVTVANNTVYNNYLDTLNPGTARGELSNGGSQKIVWVNNIAIAVPGGGVLANNEPIVTFPVSGGFTDTGSWTQNIAYGAAVTSDKKSNVSPATNLIGVNPELTSLRSDNFIPLQTSPAVGTAMPESYLPAAPAAPNIGGYYAVPTAN